MSAKKEFGDFQTPEGLATRVVQLVDELFGTPEAVIEPTAGLGTFLKSSFEHWGSGSIYEGYEINGQYVASARNRLARFGVRICHKDFFGEDWKCNISRCGKSRVLVIGNPPWITNAGLGQLGSKNLPEKSNFQRLRGLDARTGKSNFDIAEWMLIRLIEALPPDGAIAMLCKTMTARKVLRHFWKSGIGLAGSSMFRIDAKTEFNVAADACLFFARGNHTDDRTAMAYSDLDVQSKAIRFGLADGELVSDIEAYQAYRHLDGGSCLYTWRSGIKHDAAKIMEFTRVGPCLINGLGEKVDIEDDHVFPLLKSSDLANGRIDIRRAVLVTQKSTGDDTTAIKHKTPKTWAYLNRHADTLDGRKSSIYKTRPRFCIFGIGGYSFAPWKVAISGLYNNISFVIVPPCDRRPVMVDDTCYSIPCRTREEAEFLHELLSSKPATQLLKSLVFQDSKRPITVEVLRRLSFVELARELDRLDALRQFVHAESDIDQVSSQMMLLM